MIKNILKITGNLYIVFFFTNLALSQESINATGGVATGNGGTISYSIGQMFFTTNSGSGGIVEQGVQNSYEIFRLGVKETESNISISVFPNPTANNLILQISDYNHQKLSYQLLDTQGKLISNEQILDQQTQINMQSLQTANYFINIINQDNKKVESFTVIKK